MTFGVALHPIPPGRNSTDDPVGLAIKPKLAGNWEKEIALANGISASVNAEAAAGLCLELRPGSVTLGAAGTANLRARLTIHPDTPRAVFGTPGSTRLEFGAAHVEFDVRGATAGTTEASLEAVFDQASFVLDFRESDSFLRYVFGDKTIRTDFAVGVRWSSTTGFRLQGAARLETTLPIHLSIAGIVDIVSAYLAVDGSGTSAALTIAVTGKFDLGPIKATIDRVGIRAIIEGRDGNRPPGNLGNANTHVAFKPPTSVALAIDADIVKGSGFLSIDTETGRYSGGFRLQASGIEVDAVGLLVTALPDGSPIPSPGWSLLVLITAGQLGIQLGFGFTLQRVGGLLGIHRSASVPALRDAVRTGALGATLFPTAGQITTDGVTRLTTLDQFFPLTPGRYVFGPMAQLGWGPGAVTFVTLDLAILFELPAPLRLIIAGTLHLALPTPDTALVRINMDCLGVLDLAAREASLDASLYDSTVGGLALTGDMAMRLRWGDTPAFALSVGGFNPRFTPPPGFPVLRRAAISLSDSSDARLRFEAYLAVTAGTVQFGARLEIGVSLGEFSIRGLLYFDALFRFSPHFGFRIDCGAGVSVDYGSFELFSVQLDLCLAGTDPWEARGLATISILGMHITGHFHRTWGQAPSLPPQGSVDVGILLARELAEPETWSAQVPPDAAAAVRVREAHPGPGELLAHPAGSVSFMQRVIPLDTTIERYGNALLTPGTGDRFTISRAWYGDAGGGQIEVEAREPLYASFALAEFVDLSDDEKLSGPAFFTAAAGERFGQPAVAARDRGDRAKRAMVVEYEPVYADQNTPTRPPPARPPVISAEAERAGASTSVPVEAGSVTATSRAACYAAVAPGSPVDGMVDDYTRLLASVRREEPGRRVRLVPVSAPPAVPA